MRYLVITTLLSAYVYAETISGTIKDRKTGEPLPYANIVIQDTAIGTASDINGYYIIPSMGSGTYILKVMMIGYAISDNII
ncbi:uncharacterized protein METZ01_LOCUS170157, partial [marine metagenome]